MSMLGTLSGIAVVLAASALGGRILALPAPFDGAVVVVVLAVLAVSVLFSSSRHLPAYFAGTGLFATAGLVGSAFLIPRMGLAPLFAAWTLGTVAGTLVVDHIGAFGMPPISVTAQRLLGVGLVALGTILVRTAA